jgi:hypothetical protein
MTDPQLKDPAFYRWQALLPQEDSVTLEMQWSAAFALEALEKLGFYKPGSRGVLVGDATLVLAPLSAAGCQLTCIGKKKNSYPVEANCEWVDVDIEDLSESIIHCDFAIVFSNIEKMKSYDEWLSYYNAVMRCLLREGVGVFLFNYWPDSWGSKPSDLSFIPSENHIARIALHAIGHGSMVTQLLMGPIPPNPDRQKIGHPFTLLVLR